MLARRGRVVVLVALLAALLATVALVGLTAAQPHRPAPPSSGREGSGLASPASNPRSRRRWVPPQHLTWYWQLQGSIDNNHAVAAYDIDGFDTPRSEVSRLHALGRHVICYIDAGTYEPWRPDARRFPATVLGSAVEGWAGERWLDIRQLSILQPILSARLRMCAAKHFDAVEPDNVDGFENHSGFPLTAREQLTYDSWLAAEAHRLGLAAFQKNDAQQVPVLVSHFDGALSEQCNQYNECSSWRPYLRAGKPVLNAEYVRSRSAFCAADTVAGIMGARYSLNLDGSTFEPCW